MSAELLWPDRSEAQVVPRQFERFLRFRAGGRAVVDGLEAGAMFLALA